ncbi:hypothetical protein GSH19_03165 [Lactobacillus sp. S2-2]|uniref:hypothetical protein n=1 Tax=Lactobacillus sp. S2-2 TaxID=2692917 RepID=UPI001F375EE2|nr:hypothetical protein [Lactobacillus sp. S2-2]MCF6515165.1 hypothetical protein [Lactobacillus sp. S2-2]
MKKSIFLAASIISSIALIKTLSNKKSKNINKNHGTFIYKIKDINNQKKNFTLKLNNFKNELPKVNDAINDINQNVKISTFKISPRLKRIQNRLENL